MTITQEDKMNVTTSTTIHNLIESYPFMLDWLTGYHPDYVKLKNPVLRNTMGRVATIGMAASMANVAEDKLLGDIRAEVSRQTGEKIESAETSVGSPSPDKIETLKGLIRELHEGVPAETVKGRFAELVKDVAPGEIAEMEQQLIAGGLPQGEIKRLCDVHVQIFKDALENESRPAASPGHPVHTMMTENFAVKGVINSLRRLAETFDRDETEPLWDEADLLTGKLAQIERHYLRKEYQLFPFLEKQGFSGPSQVMWEIHDDIRKSLKSVQEAVAARDGEAFRSDVIPLVQMIEDMIYKEEHILFPVSLDLLDDAAWVAIRDGGEQYGYTLIHPMSLWRPKTEAVPAEEKRPGWDRLPLDTGLLSLGQINLIFKHLPIEISFVNENDEVAYYTELPEKIFPRSPGVIGRKVQNCHPPKSLDKVNRILAELKAGTRDVAEFWIQMKGKFLHIRYFAVRDASGNYKGTLETVQDVTGIRALEGEQRLMG